MQERYVSAEGELFDWFATGYELVKNYRINKIVNHFETRYYQKIFSFVISIFTTYYLHIFVKAMNIYLYYCNKRG